MGSCVQPLAHIICKPFILHLLPCSSHILRTLPGNLSPLSGSVCPGHRVGGILLKTFTTKFGWVSRDVDFSDGASLSGCGDDAVWQEALMPTILAAKEQMMLILRSVFLSAVLSSCLPVLQLHPHTPKCILGQEIQ